MEISTKNYTVTRIRLINWHNFLDETISVAEGGHLFLLGDNGSGKTTVLDAVHYVLTAGDNLEFNSAARVAGSREDGRRVQGVVMRYNSETGPLNTTGGITYAAVEVRGRNGKLSTYGVGLEVYAMDQHIRRWGIIRECPLEDIPLLVERDGDHFPASRQEIKKHFGTTSAYYSNIETYKREVARRLFSDKTAFTEITRLLSMGKAYREIVSHAGDYHELFKRLLPEPQPDIFEKIIGALTSLEQSSGTLEGLEEQLKFVKELAGHVTRIEDLREEALRLDWLRTRFELEENEENLRRNQENAVKIRLHRGKIEAEIAAGERDREALEQQIADLQVKDASGLVRQEKETAKDEERLMTEQADAKEKARQAASGLTDAERKLKKQRKELVDTLRKLFTELNRLAPKLPFPVSELTSALDEAFRTETPETDIDTLPFADILARLQEFRTQTATGIGRLEEQEKRLKIRFSELEACLQGLRKKVDLAPDIPGFRESLTALRGAMFSPLPLYEGLEWQSDVPDSRKAAIEEAIGLDILATFIVQGEGSRQEEAARIVFQTASGLRIAEVPETVKLPQWIRDSFDISRSDPDALKVLAEEMITRLGPEVKNDDFPILRFRAHQRRLHGHPARLIGAHTRKAALEEQIRDAEENLARVGKEQGALQKESKNLRQSLERLDQSGALLAKEEKNLHLTARTVIRDTVVVEGARNRAAETAESADHAEHRLKNCRDRLKKLRAHIHSEGLDHLEKNLRAAARKKEKIQTRINELNQELGTAGNQIKGLQQQWERLTENGKAIQQDMNAVAANLLDRLSGISNLEKYVLETHQGKRFNSLDQILGAQGENERNQASQATEINLRVRDDRFGAVFGFAYDPEANELLDRRQRPIATVVTDQTRQVDEQRDIVSEKNRELFRKLVVGELLNHLREKIEVLERMVRDINGELGKRAFGPTTYRFELRTVDRFKRLAHLVRNYNPWKSEKGEDELRQFFEDQRDAITNTEVGSVPEHLDYRNWFHYNMLATSTGGEGVVMDRHTKAVGSGGEQAVPNYLLFLTVAHFMFKGNEVPLRTLLFDEAFYGIDSGRRDQILGFASDLGLQLFVASPDQDGVRQEVHNSTTILVVKDQEHQVHLHPFDWINPRFHHRDIFEEAASDGTIAFGEELAPATD